MEYLTVAYHDAIYGILEAPVRNHTGFTFTGERGNGRGGQVRVIFAQCSSQFHLPAEHESNECTISKKKYYFSKWW